MSESTTSTEARSYWVGLPVGITVADDGTVTYEVDTSEAGQAIMEIDYNLYDNEGKEIVIPEEVMLADRDRIDADHDRRHAAREV
jgi:hypothetical protein